MAITSAAGFGDVLQTHRILSKSQMDEVNGDLQRRFPDSRAMARELLQRGWLTAFQVNYLLQGRGAELVLGPYLLLERLGGGGMGQVFKARHQLMDRTVAVKVIRKELLANPDAVERFQREIRLAAQLDHPHLVRAHDAAQVGDTHFLVMEYAEGIDLQRLLQKSGPLPTGQACSYARQAALGLQHAAERGLVHRDVKPSNLQVNAQGTIVKILDMGLARSQVPDGGEGGRPELTQARTVMGTPDYMAPEQIADARRVDIRADIYSLGCTLYFLLVGRPPFPVDAWEEKLVCHRKVEPQPIEQLRPDVPPALGAVLRKMMAKRPEDRYATPAAVAEALAPFCALTGPAPVVPGVAPGAGLRSTLSGSQTPGSAPALPPAPVNPSAGHEAGWTLNVDPSMHAAPPAPQTRLPAPLAQTTSLLPEQHLAPQAAGQPAPGGRKRLLLLLAAGGAVVGLSILLLLVWPKGDGQVAQGNEPPGRSKEQPRPPEVKKYDIAYDMDHVETVFGIKLKAATFAQGKTEGDTLVTMTLEFTQDFPIAVVGKSGKKRLPPMTVEYLRASFAGETTQRYFGAEGMLLKCYFFDEGGVAFMKQPPGKIEGEVSGKEGDAFRITQTVPNAVLAKTKKISFREEPTGSSGKKKYKRG